MQQRINVHQLDPSAFDVMITMEKHIATTDLSIQLRELIKIRASQINHCAYCLDMHTKDARKEGLTEQKLNVIAAWEESPLFDEAERAALKFTEEVTKIADHGVSDTTFNELQKHFTNKQIAQMIIVINQINSWNRIAVATKQLHPID
ncbi:MAG TPA: carboxymuconolactone decarboxylase family protein [Candidatus Kapabacteria bacterium]|nr:carboxymuconolactone decarboxylase family protein [Candidatus Kapabacteria bacterium]